MADCIFCRIARKEIPSRILFEDDELIAFEDADPQAPVHFLVVPKEHIPTVVEVPDSKVGLLGRMVQVGTIVANGKGLEPKGYRFVLNHGKDGGQAVGHIHLHVMGGRAMGWPPG
jgi:histidine triad (HIT) family protein